MKFGLVLPNFAAWFTPGNIRATLSLAEELGYDSVWVNDHVVFPGNMAQHYGNQFLDPLALLPFLAACSERLLLGTSVLVVPYRPPIPTAKALASIDRLSDGRLLVGIGVGHEPQESEVLGLPYHERGQMTDEFIRIMVALWTDAVVSFQGRYYSFQNVRPLMPPVQQPHPPLFIGGTSDAALRRIVEFNAGWHPSGGGNIERLRPRVEKARQMCAEKSRPFPPTSVRWSCHPVPEGDPGAGQISATSVGETQRRRLTPSQIRSEVGAYESLGVERIVVDVPANRGVYLEQLRKFAAVVF
jgi:probable F420-dependent oxidoreductase